MMDSVRVDRRGACWLSLLDLGIPDTLFAFPMRRLCKDRIVGGFRRHCLADLPLAMSATDSDMQK